MTEPEAPLEQWHLPGGSTVKLGNRAYDGMPVLSAMFALPDIPDSELRAFDLRTNPYYPLRIKDQGSTGSCFPPGTLVRMEDGSERPIENVRLLDRVLTAEGNTGRVIRTMVREADDGLLNILLWGHNSLRCTQEHPILTKRGYVAAEDIRLDDMVAMPRYLPAGTKSICPSSYFVATYNVRKSSSSAVYRTAPEGRRVSLITKHHVPDVVQLTPEFGRLVGLFLAEGSTSACKTLWSFGKHERDTLVAETVQLIEAAFGQIAHVQERPRCINVVLYGTEFARFFEGLCATGSGSKHVHPDLAAGPAEFLSAVLDGWIAGDGHQRRRETQGVTVSKQLAFGMYDIAQGLGRRPAIRCYHSPTYGTVKERRPRWEVTWNQATDDTYRSEQTDTHVWRKVRGIEHVEYAGPVYNLEVEGDNSYVAEGVGVHNCNGHAAATSLELARFFAGESYVTLSPFFIYSILCGGVDRGSIISEALTLLRDRGTCPDELVPHGTINPNKLSTTAKTEAKRFRVEIGYKINSHRDMVVATHLRIPLNYSVAVNSNFNTLDSDGVPGNRAGSHNHAVSGGMGLKKTAKYGWVVLTANSWNTNWGDRGFFWAAEKTIAGSYSDAYGVVAVEFDPNDPPPSLA